MRRKNTVNYIFQISTKSQGMPKCRAYVRWSTLRDNGPIYFCDGNRRSCFTHRLQVCLLYYNYVSLNATLLLSFGLVLILFFYDGMISIYYSFSKGRRTISTKRLTQKVYFSYLHVTFFNNVS